MRRSGHPHVLTADELQKIQQGIESGDYPDASAAHCVLVPHVDVTTVRHALREMGLYGRRRRAVPVLTAKHAYQHLNWALKQQHWQQAKRQSVVYSDTQMSAVLRWKVTMGLSIAGGLRIQHYSPSMQSQRLHMAAVGS